MGIPPWCWLDGTGRVIWQRTRVLLLGGLTANHTTAVFVFSLAEREKKQALHFTLQTAKNAMETRFPGFKWDLGMFMSDGAEEMINAARAVWLTILWLLCYWHAQKNMREHLKENIADKDLRPEVHANLRDLHLSWSTPVWQAGWVALEDHYSATPHYLDHAREQYIHKRSGWFVGQSPPGVPCSTPAEARAQSLKLVTQHKLRGIREFLKDVLPRLGTQWAQSREQLGGRGMQPAPWMWQEAQVMLNNKVFVDDGDALHPWNL